MAAGPGSDAPPGVARAGLPKGDRIRARTHFLRVQRHGRRVHSRHFLVMILAGADADGRQVGFTVTKRVSKAAVRRNRVKRVLREVFRRNRDLFPAGCEMVIIAKQGAPELGYEEALGELEGLRSAMRGAARKALKDMERSAERRATDTRGETRGE